MKKLIALSLIAILLNTLSAFADVPVLSVDEQGNETVTMISDNDFQQATLVKADALSDIAEDQMNMNMASMSPHLTLRGILVGLEATGTVGVGAFKVGTGINQQFYFEINQ